MSDEIYIEKSKDSTYYFKQTLVSNAILINNCLNKELSKLENDKDVEVTDKLIQITIGTIEITKLAFFEISKIDTIIKNTMS